jgi:hypothetical protein
MHTKFWEEIHKKEITWEDVRLEWEDIFKMDLKETELERVDSICVVQLRDQGRAFVYTAVNVSVP